MKKCANCGRDITPEMESPETDHCDECFIYGQDIQAERQEEGFIVSREMAMDAGFPEMEGMRW